MSDNAERLHTLICNITGALSAIGGTNQPMWQLIDPIAKKVGQPDYGELRDRFLGLCNAIRDEVRTMPMNKETVRANWLNCMTNISRVFDAQNFGEPSLSVFNRHFSEANLNILDSISERLQISGYTESTQEELEAALSAVRNVINEFEKCEKLGPRVGALLKHYLQQMETIYSQVEDFGDDAFWRSYKVTFATFVQLHPVIATLDNAEEIKSKLRVAAECLGAKSLAGVSLAADLATIGAVLTPMLMLS